MEISPITLQPLITQFHLGSSTHDQSQSESSSSPRDIFTRVSSTSSPTKGKSVSVSPAVPFVRCAKALGKDIYVGCSDGTLIRCNLRDDGPSTGDAYTVTSRQTVPSKKAIDEIALAPSVSKALVLSGGLIYFYTLPSLEPVPPALINPIRGVVTFTLDDSDFRKDQYAPPKATLQQGQAPWNASTRNNSETVGICVVRERNMGLYNLRERLQPVKEFPLPAHIAAKRSGKYLCVADAENYSVVDLEATQLIPVAPLQGAEPLIAVVGLGEFIIGSSTGASTLGIFINGNAEPTRQPMEWPVHPLSICVEYPLVAALLPDRTIHIHSAETQTLIHVVSPPSPSLSPSLVPTSLSFNPGSFSIPSLLRNRLLRKVKFYPLPRRPLSGGRDVDSNVPPSTPTKTTYPESEPVAVSVEATASALMTSESRVLVVGADGMQAFVPATLLSRAETLLEESRIDELDRLASEQSIEGNGQADELQYIYARLAFKCLSETLFDDAGEHFFKSRADPRLLIRLFPDLRGTLISRGHDTVEVFAGLEPQLRLATSIDDLIMANLVRNYSPIKPNVKTAPSTAELSSVLHDSARIMLMRYLRKLRESRPPRVAGRVQAQNDATEDLSYQIDKTVDTVFVRLLAETDQRAELKELLKTSLDTIVLDEIETSLVAYGQLSALVTVYQRLNDEAKLLNLWSKVAQGDWSDASIENPLGEIVQLLSTTRNMELVQTYGVWLAQHDPLAAFTLFISPRDSKRGVLKLDEEEILKIFRGSNPLIADQYLEHLVLNKNSSDSTLHEELSTKYLGEVVSSLEEQTVSDLFLSSVSEYIALKTKEPFLVYFSKHVPDSDAKTARLKAILFLQGSSFYDVTAARKIIDSKRDVLMLERAILDGKMGNDRSALTSLVQLGDFTSAEVYCTLGGEVIPGKVAQFVGERSQLQAWAGLVVPPQAGKKKKPSSRSGVDDSQRTRHLLKILMEVYTRGGREVPSDETADLLNSQAVNLDVVDVLSNVPSNWSLSVISSFLTRSFRRSQHQFHEGMIIKGVSWGQNLKVMDQAFTVIREEGGFVEEPSTPPPPPDEDSEEAQEQGGEPSSLVEEKVGLFAAPEPVVGSVTSVELVARKEGFVSPGDEEVRIADNL